MSVLVTSIEHGFAVVVHDIAVGARWAAKAIAVVENNAPAVEAITALIDPRAAAIERTGAAVIGAFAPFFLDVANTADKTKLVDLLGADFVHSLEGFFTEFKAEFAQAKQALSGK